MYSYDLENPNICHVLSAALLVGAQPGILDLLPLLLFLVPYPHPL